MKKIIYLLVIAIALPFFTMAQETLFFDDFEGSNDTWHTGADDVILWEYLNGSAGGFSPIDVAYSGELNATVGISENENKGEISTLYSPQIDLKGNSEVAVSFMLGNPDWSGDIDKLEVYFSDGNSEQLLETIDYAVEEWTQYSYTVPNITGNYGVVYFKVTHNYGYRVTIDDVKVTSAVSEEVSIFFDDFEGTNDTWRTDDDDVIFWSYKSGSYNGDTPIKEAYSGALNATVGITGNTDKGKTSTLYSPDIDLTGVSEITVSFQLGNPIWVDDFDKLEVYFWNGSSEELIGTIDYAVEEWTEFSYTVSNLNANYGTVNFKVTHNYGYGVTIDDVKVVGSVSEDVTTRVLTDIASKYSWLDDNEDGLLDEMYYSVDENNNLTELIISGESYADENDEIVYIDYKMNGSFNFDLSGCTELITLNLSNNKLGSFTSDLLECTSLQKLDLSACELSNLTLNLADCKNLTWLGLKHNDWYSFELLLGSSLEDIYFDTENSGYNYAAALEEFTANNAEGYFAYTNKHYITDADEVIFTPTSLISDAYDLVEEEGDDENVFQINGEDKLLLMKYSQLIANKTSVLDVSIREEGDFVVPGVIVVDLFDATTEIRKEIAKQVNELDSDGDNLADEKYFVFDDNNNILEIKINQNSLDVPLSDRSELKLDFYGCNFLTKIDLVSAGFSELDLNMQALEELTYFDIDGNPLTKLMLSLPYQEIDNFYANYRTINEDVDGESEPYSFEVVLQALNTTDYLFFKYIQRSIFHENYTVLSTSYETSSFEIIDGGDDEDFIINEDGNLAINGTFNDLGTLTVSVNETDEFETIGTGTVVIERAEDQYTMIATLLAEKYPELPRAEGFTQYVNFEYLEEGIMISQRFGEEGLFPNPPLDGAFDMDLSEFDQLPGIILDGNNFDAFNPVLNNDIQHIILSNNNISEISLNMTDWSNFRIFNIDNNPLESILISLPTHELADDGDIIGLDLDNTQLPEAVIAEIKALNTTGMGGLYGYKKFNADVIAGTTVFESFNDTKLEIIGGNDNNWFEILDGTLLLAANVDQITEQTVVLDVNLTDEAGNVIASGTIRIDTENSVGIRENVVGSFKIYPTVTSGQITIEKTDIEFNKVELISAMGQVISTYNLSSNNETINVNDMSNGMYFVRLVSNTAKTELQKIIVE